MQFGFAKTEESVVPWSRLRLSQAEVSPSHRTVGTEARVEGAMTHHKQVQQERHDEMLLSPRLRA